MHTARRWVIALFLVAFFVARLTGAHLHLCLDGSEPPAQLHVSDSAEVGHHIDDAQSHDDVDVDALGSVLAKVAKLDLPAITLTAWCLALLFVVVMRQPASVAVRRSPHRPSRYLRPLLRAPPA